MTAKRTKRTRRSMVSVVMAKVARRRLSRIASRKGGIGMSP